MTNYGAIRRVGRVDAVQAVQGLFAILCVSLLLPSCRSTSSGYSLFDGQTLDGWRVHGTERWYVEDGELVGESGPDAEYGYLATEDTFKDFDLMLEFMQEAGGNSGLFFRSSLDGTRITGWQAEIAPPGGNTGGIYESYGRGWLIKPAEGRNRSLKVGEWNTMRLRVIGDEVTTWLNGEKMVEYADEMIGKGDGVIALQIHDGGGVKVRWRNITVRRIDGETGGG